MERRRIEFSGKVQGVGFRATARDIAAAYPVTGWVRNEPDGSVLLELQGPGTAIQACLNDLHARLGWRITAEQQAMIGDVPDERGFEVRR